MRDRLLAFIIVSLIAVGPRARAQEDVTIFDLPARFRQINALLQQVQRARAANKLGEAEKLANEAAQVLEPIPETLFQLAVIQIQRGRHDEAFNNISKAVDSGFNKPQILQQAIFAPLANMDGWKELLAKAKTARPDSNALWQRRAVPANVEKLSLIHISEPTRPY